MAESTKEEWVSFRDAARLISKSTPEIAGHMIATRARNGMVRARAKSRCDKPDTRDESIVRNELIPDWFWVGTDDMGRSKLSPLKNEIHSYHQFSHYYSRAFGVEIYLDDIRNIISPKNLESLSARNRSVSAPEPKVGPPKKVEAWENVHILAMQMYIDGDLNHVKNPTQLRRAVMAKWQNTEGETPLGDTSLRDWSNKFFYQVIEYGRDHRD